MEFLNESVMYMFTAHTGKYGVFWQQAITWTNVDQVLPCLMVLPRVMN